MATATLAQVADSGLLMPVAAPERILEAHKAAVELVNRVLEDGTDFGTVPGAGSKPALFKAGAERLCSCYGLSIQYALLEQEIDHSRENFYTDKYKKRQSSQGLYRYVVKCDLVSRQSGAQISEAIGTCSTMESKYISRPTDCENTVMKMAQKRALVAACLHAFGLSDRFTQDVEDLHPSVRGGDTQSGVPTRPRSAPDNYLTVTRGPNDDEHEFAESLRRKLAFSREQFQLLRGYSTPVDVRFVLIEAFYRGLDTIEKVFDLVKVPGADSPPSPTADAPNTQSATSSESDYANVPKERPNSAGGAVSQGPPAGANAFGYTPTRWPLPNAFAVLASDKQAESMQVKGDARGIPTDDLPVVRGLVLQAYRIEQQIGQPITKAAAAIVIDWLSNATEASVDAAVERAQIIAKEIKDAATEGASDDATSAPEAGA